MTSTITTTTTTTTNLQEMATTTTSEKVLRARLALLLRRADTTSATQFAYTYAYHDSLTKEVSSSGLLPIHYASLLGGAGLIRALVKGGARVDSKSMSIASKGGHVQALEALLQLSRNGLVKECGEALFEACYCGSLDCVSLLVAYGAPIDFKGVDGSEPLHMAAMCGSIAMVDCLLNAGANPFAKCYDGCTPILCAKRIGHAAVASKLKGAGVELEYANNQNGQQQQRVAPVGIVAASGLSPTMSHDEVMMDLGMDLDFDSVSDSKCNNNIV